jgi:PilZ domain
VLAFFVDDAGQLVEDRRSSPRFRAVVQRAWLGWWTSPGEFGSVAARLDDISLGGARVATANPPAAQQLVWLCLGIPDPTECVQAKVLEVSPGSGGEFIVRLAFGAPCPQNLYQTAVYGFERNGR